MKILFVAGEANPFIKTGGLGDVMGALPQALKELGVEARVIIPKYKNIINELSKNLKFIKHFNVQLGWRNQYCGIFEHEFEGVIYYLVDNEFYFNRDNLYGYGDDEERFSYFDKAVLETICEIEWYPDIIHCNDWHSGMIPVLLKLDYSKRKNYSEIKTVTSIHNLLFQGVFSKEILGDYFGYDDEVFNNGSLEFHGGISFMKGAISYSDRISTVSKTYAEEIQTPQYGEKLDGLLKHKNYMLKGIVNGIDYKEYNPCNDHYIYKKFNKKNIEYKLENKLALQRELGLPEKANTPMIGIVSRLAGQKGFDLILSIIDEFLQKDIQIVLLGTGDREYEEHFRMCQGRYRDKISANIKFDNILAHKIYSASDMFLMPSYFEPCGLGQLIALRYGSIPIVRETGGLKDTIVNYDEYNNVGNGFTFKEYNANALKKAINNALKVYENREIWQKLIKEAMESDNSWGKSAKEYMELYQGLIEG